MMETLNWRSFVAPLLVAVVVGVGASYVTTRVQIGTLKQRMDQAEASIVRLRSQVNSDRKTQRELTERIVRMETKIDLLLQSRGIDPSTLPPDQQ